MNDLHWLRRLGVGMAGLWGTAVYGTFWLFGQLDERYDWLMGIAAIMLLFLGIGLLGMYMELHQMLLFNKLRARVIGRMVLGLVSLVVLFPAGLGGVVWVSQLVWGRWLGLSEEWVYWAYLAGALLYVYGFISVLGWLSDKGYLDWWAG